MILRKKLSSKLAPMHYEHPLGVSFTCMNLTMRYRYDLDKVELAGLIRDCRKCYSDDIILKKCIEYGIEVTGAELSALPVLRAKYGTWLAERKYQIMNREILNTIGCRTMGKPDMTALDRTLYIAGYIEPRRFRAENLPLIRRLAYENLDEIIYATLSETLEYLDKKDGSIDSITVGAYEYFKEMKGDSNELKGDG